MNFKLSLGGPTLFLVVLVGNGAVQVGNNRGVTNPNLAGKEELISLPHAADELARLGRYLTLEN